MCQPSKTIMFDIQNVPETTGENWRVGTTAQKNENSLCKYGSGNASVTN
jgi:hypothetical protein